MKEWLLGHQGSFLTSVSVQLPRVRLDLPFEGLIGGNHFNKGPGKGRLLRGSGLRIRCAGKCRVKKVPEEARLCKRVVGIILEQQPACSRQKLLRNMHADPC